MILRKLIFKNFSKNRVDFQKMVCNYLIIRRNFSKNFFRKCRFFLKKYDFRIFLQGFAIFRGFCFNFAGMKKADIIRDLTLATKQRKFAADFLDVFGYSFSVVEDWAAKDKEIAALLNDYYDMLRYAEEKAYFEGVAKGRFQNVLEKRLIKSGFIDANKLELSGSIPAEIIENMKGFLNGNSEV